MNPDATVGFLVMGFALKAILIVGAIVLFAGFVGGYTGSAVTRYVPRIRHPFVGAVLGAVASALWMLVILSVLAYLSATTMGSVYLPFAIPAAVSGAMFGAFFIRRDQPTH